MQGVSHTAYFRRLEGHCSAPGLSSSSMVMATSLQQQALPNMSTSCRTVLGRSSLRDASCPLVADSSSHAGCDVRFRLSGVPATTCTHASFQLMDVHRKVHAGMQHC